MGVVQIISYIGVLVFLVATLSKIIRVARMPVHLRWELYPVPHEKGKAHYGGSKMEESRFWEKETEKDHLNEIKEMGKEILFLKAVWEHNRKLWVGSFPFHFSLYMMITNIVLLLFAAILSLNGIEIRSDAAGFWGFYYYFIYVIAWVSSIIGLIGLIRVFFLRIVDVALKNYSNASHYFNIIFIGAINFTLLLWLINDPNVIDNLIGFYKSLIIFSLSPVLSWYASAHIVIASLFMLYLPFTHMSHMYMKYFLYHLVRWEDEDMKPGSKLSRAIGEQLAYPVTWSAAHIKGDGKKTWADIVSEIPEED